MRGMVRAGCAASVLTVLVLAACASRPRAGAATQPGILTEAFQPTPGAPFDPPPGPQQRMPAGPVGVDAMKPLHPDVLARVNGEPILKRELAEFLCVNDPNMARLFLSSLVKMRIFRAEAKRLGVTAPEAAVDQALERILADLTRVAESNASTPQKFVQDRLGVTYPVYCEMQRSHARFELTRERLVRYAQILDDCVEGRIIVIPEREEAVKVVSQIREGADFAAVARESSKHLSRNIGGRLPLIGRWGVQPKLEERLFSLRPGEVSDPMPHEENGRQLWVVLKCVKFHPARRVGFAEVAAEIEAGLTKRSFFDMEVDNWYASLGERYKVEYSLQAVEPGAAGGQAR